MKFEK